MVIRELRPTALLHPLAERASNLPRSSQVDAGCGLAAQPVVVACQLDEQTTRRVQRLLGTVGIAVHLAELEPELERPGRLPVPSCVLIDPTCAPRDRWLRAPRAGRWPPVICLATWPSLTAVVEAMRAGAWTCLEESVSDQDLLDEIDRAIQEDGRRWSADSEVTGWRRKFGRLSGREVEVLRQTIDGLTSKEVGRRLAISPRTVDAHRAGILRKLGVSRLNEAVLHFCRLLEE